MNPLKFLIFVFLIIGGILISAQNTKAQTGYMSSFLEVINDTVFGQSETSLYNYSFTYYYDVGVVGRLYNQNQNLLASNSQQRVNPYAQASTAVYGAVRGQNYKLISTHTAYAQYIRYNEDQQVFLYQDPSGISEFGPAEYPSFYEIQTSQSRQIVNETIDLGTTSVTIQVPLTAPQLTSIDVDTGLPGGEPIQTYLRGSNLFGNNRYIIVNGGGGVNVTLYPLTNSTDVVDVKIQIDSTAPLGDRQISLGVDGQTSNSLTFHVGDRTPRIDLIDPSQLNAGQGAWVTITGTNFGTNPALSVACCGVNISQKTTNAAGTQIQAYFSVDNSANAGIRDVKVTSNGISGTNFVGTTGQTPDSNSVGFGVVVTPSQPTITDVGVVEKNNLKEVAVSNSDAGANDKTKFRIRRLSGTGSAAFEDGSMETQEYTGMVSSRTLRIKGVTESSQANNFVIEALVNGSSKLSKNFTVATITTLAFEKYLPDYENIIDNPGNGEPNTMVGQRIFPDKKTPGDTTDRAVVKVIATVLPTLPDVQVYFGSYDLDDPSANVGPIDFTDTTGIRNGNDNNGQVNGSKSGDFTVQLGITCTGGSTGTSSPPLNTVPPFVSTIGCSIYSDGTATAAFNVTTQPGDNFAVAASLTDTYRDKIKVNVSNGIKLIDATNRTIPVSGQPNTEGAPAIRTDMLTVWRRLHIEVDSMGYISGNHVTGTVFGIKNNPNERVTLTLNNSPSLEIDRFEDGRLVIGTSSYTVCPANPFSPGSGNANTANTVTIFNPFYPGGTLSIRASSSFTLYDDDDFNSNDGTTTSPLHGDEGENVTEPSMALLTDESDDPTTNALAPAYIKTVLVKEGVLDIRDNSVFSLNTVSHVANDTRQLFADYDLTSGNIDNNFWTVYILGAYQDMIHEDGDPRSEEDIVLGRVDAVTRFTQDFEGSGALIFMELHRTQEIPGYTPDPNNTNSVANTVVHEVGHLFSALHGEGGVMGIERERGIPVSNKFSVITLDKIRKLAHP